MNDSTIIPIRADVPLDLHPDTLAPFATALEHEEAGATGALASGREALAAMYELVAAMRTAERELQRLAPDARRRERPDGSSQHLGDLRMTDGSLRRFHGHEEEFAAAAEQAFQRADVVAVRRIRELVGYETALRKRVNAALDYPDGRGIVGVAQAGEIRAHLKGLAQSERTELLNRAFAAFDRQTIAAVITAPGYLSGLSHEHHEGVHANAQRVWAPHQSAALHAVLEVANRVSNGRDIMKKQLVQAQKQSDAPQAKARAVVGQLGQAAR